ncbi:MAG: hypothetical protein Q8Q33_05615 [Chlamydiota bacterium]|nr:hypothetical protein [Chlamydiota bacterium]
MTTSIRLGKEIIISARNKIGILLNISGILCSKGINIHAISAHAAGNFALIGLITSNNKKALSILKRKGYEAVENPVIITELINKPGFLMKVTNTLVKHKLDIFNIYGGATLKGENSILVFTTSDNVKALAVLKKILTQ